MVVRGVWPIFTLFTALSMLGVLITGAYILKGIRAALHGPLNEKWSGHMLEINRRETIAIAPLMGLMLLIGVWPNWIVVVINQTAMRLLGS
jgi:NADH-quinone oxidoreductase subunit M